MPFKYRVLTANCGNDTIGADAVRGIVAQFNEDHADFYIINCQEVSFSKTLRQLRAQDGNLSITCSGYMPTHTKLATQFHADTGIATFILHKKQTGVSKESTAAIRRKPTRLAGGSGYNKGGIISTFSISRTGEPSLKIETVSAHLDSSSAEKRSIDWQNIHEARRFNTFESFQALEQAYLNRPMIIAVGIDANTRNKVITPFESAQNPWKNPDTDPELASLHQAPIGMSRFSAASTYRAYTQNIQVDTTPDRKRPGYTVGGSLDHVFISGGKNDTKTENPVIVIDPERSTKRDHSIIISPLQTSEVRKDNQIQNLMANDLRHASPFLAQQLENPDISIGEKTLLSIHNLLLSKEGLLQKMVKLHARKLALIKRLDSITISPKVCEELSALLFPKEAWLERIQITTLDTETALYSAQIERMNSLLNIMDEHPLNETLLSACMNLFTEQNESTPVHERLRSALETKYEQENCFIPEREVSTDTSDMSLEVHLKHCMDDVIRETRSLGAKQNSNPLSAYDLSLLVEVLKQCNEITSALETQKTQNAQTKALLTAVNKLSALSHQVSGRKSPGWNNLGRALIGLGLSAAVLGIMLAPPTFGVSLIIPIALALAGALCALVGQIVSSMSEEKGLAKAISHDTQALIERLESREDSPRR